METDNSINICPICHNSRKDREDNKFFPFCSQRCKDADLYMWFNEEHSLPIFEPEIWSEDE